MLMLIAVIVTVALQQIEKIEENNNELKKKNKKEIAIRLPSVCLTHMDLCAILLRLSKEVRHFLSEKSA